MNSTITSVGGRAPPVRKTPILFAGSVRALQLSILALEFLQPLALVGGKAGCFPESRPAWRTHLRSVSVMHPIVAAINFFAIYSES
jgi:hypothetical protein